HSFSLLLRPTPSSPCSPHRRPSVPLLGLNFPRRVLASAPVGSYRSHRSPHRQPLSICSVHRLPLVRCTRLSYQPYTSSYSHLHRTASHGRDPFPSSVATAFGSLPVIVAVAVALRAIGIRASPTPMPARFAS